MPFLVLLMPLFPLTNCKQCGAAVRRMNDKLYRLDHPTVLHQCRPQQDDTPLTLYADPKP